MRVTEKNKNPQYVFDANNANFLYVNFKYDTGSSTLSAFGKSTMSGRSRDLGAKEAMKQALLVAKDLEAKYDIEDIDVYDMENGIVQIFAVSDDFEKLNPNFSNISERKVRTINEGMRVKTNYLHLLQLVFPTTSTKELENYARVFSYSQSIGFGLRSLDEIMGVEEYDGNTNTWLSSCTQTSLQWSIIPHALEKNVGVDDDIYDFCEYIEVVIDGDYARTPTMFVSSNLPMELGGYESDYLDVLQDIFPNAVLARR